MTAGCSHPVHTPPENALNVGRFQRVQGFQSDTQEAR
jgi:hypothetical protein